MAQGRLPRDRDLAKVADGRTYPRVRITWRDSTTQRGWRRIDDLRRDSDLCVEIETEGKLLRRSATEWVVTASVASDGAACDAIAIPRGCVTSVKWVR